MHSLKACGLSRSSSSSDSDSEDLFNRYDLDDAKNAFPKPTGSAKPSNSDENGKRRDRKKEQQEGNRKNPNQDPGKSRKRVYKFDQVQQKIHELTIALKRADVFVGELEENPSLISQSQETRGSKQRKGGGKGNSKEHKKRLKKQHEMLQARWLVHLEQLAETNGIEF